MALLRRVVHEPIQSARPSSKVVILAVRAQERVARNLDLAAADTSGVMRRFVAPVHVEISLCPVFQCAIGRYVRKHEVEPCSITRLRHAVGRDRVPVHHERVADDLGQSVVSDRHGVAEARACVVMDEVADDLQLLGPDEVGRGWTGPVGERLAGHLIAAVGKASALL